MRTATGFLSVLSALVLLSGTAGAGAVVRWSPSGSETVLIPAGPFFMGYGASEAENRYAREECLEELGRIDAAACETERGSAFRYYANATPARQVDLHAFEIDRYEVTVKEYRACVRAGACDAAALLVGDTRYLDDAWPMVNVTWQDAFDYCRHHGKRLPSEAEWEKAARGTDGRRWPWGNQARKDGANHGRIEDEAVTHTHAVSRGFGVELELAADGTDGALHAAPPGRFPWGESPFAVMDMAGNVAEWVADYYWGGEDTGAFGQTAGGYADLPPISPVRATPRDRITDRVVRGGSWLLPLLFSRTYARAWAPAAARAATRGFRCARDHFPLR